MENEIHTKAIMELMKADETIPQPDRLKINLSNTVEAYFRRGKTGRVESVGEEIEIAIEILKICLYWSRNV